MYIYGFSYEYVLLKQTPHNAFRCRASREHLEKCSRLSSAKWLKPMPESVSDCFSCAKYARQRQTINLKSIFVRNNECGRAGRTCVLTFGLVCLLPSKVVCQLLSQVSDRVEQVVLLRDDDKPNDKALLRAKFDGFVPHNKHVNLRRVSPPERGSARRDGLV